MNGYETNNKEKRGEGEQWWAYSRKKKYQRGKRCPTTRVGPTKGKGSIKEDSPDCCGLNASIETNKEEEGEREGDQRDRKIDGGGKGRGSGGTFLGRFFHEA